MTARNRISLKAANRWEILDYKGKPRVVMNRNPFLVRQKITSYDVLSVEKVTQLAAWLNRYLSSVTKDSKGISLASIRANINGINREITKLEAMNRENK